MRRLIIASPRVFNLRSLSSHTRFQAFDLVGRERVELPEPEDNAFTVRPATTYGIPSHIVWLTTPL